LPHQVLHDKALLRADVNFKVSLPEALCDNWPHGRDFHAANGAPPQLLQAFLLDYLVQALGVGCACENQNIDSAGRRLLK
jgi:hypothetical protein